MGAQETNQEKMRVNGQDWMARKGREGGEGDGEGTRGGGNRVGIDQEWGRNGAGIE